MEELKQRDIYKNQLEYFVLLSNKEIRQGISLMYEHNKNIVEGAGGACLIGAYKLRKQLKGKKVVIQVSGTNETREELKKALQLNVSV